MNKKLDQILKKEMKRWALLEQRLRDEVYARQLRAKRHA
jgi:hypothetical protein